MATGARAPLRPAAITTSVSEDEARETERERGGGGGGRGQGREERLRKRARDKEGGGIEAMRVSKLVFYAQSTSMVISGR